MAVTANSREPDAKLIAALRHLGLLAAGDGADFEELTGGVSSDIWKVETPGGRGFCVKRALSKLKVAADWHAPVERNRFEVAWYEIANRFVPGSAPAVIAHDDAAMLFVMDYLDPSTHKLWKQQLRDGCADPADAADAGRRLAAIHAAAADNVAVAARFPQNDIFHAIRLEPYLEATAKKHPDLRDVLFALSRKTAMTRRTMIHGDVSPKNILIGPDGPVFLDAECACIGDPVFDLTFCLNHFLLKCLWVPRVRASLLACFDAMASTYLAGVDWEPAGDLEARAASLLPGLFLARVDGKSPVEYVTERSDKDKVRRCARRLLRDPANALGDVLEAWKSELDQ